MTTCSITNCDRPKAKRDWCSMHYQRWQRHGDPTVVKNVVRPRQDYEAIPVYDQGGERIPFPKDKPDGFRLYVLHGPDWRYVGLSKRALHRRLEAHKRPSGDSPVKHVYDQLEMIRLYDTFTDMREGLLAEQQMAHLLRIRSTRVLNKPTTHIAAKYSDLPRTHKWCNQCRSALLRSEFHKDQSSPDGIKYTCKSCLKQARIQSTT